MKWRQAARLLSVSQLLTGALGYGTTVSIAVSYCPATSTLATSTPTPTPIVLQVQEAGLTRRAAPEYIAAGGTVSTNTTLALVFTYTSIGQLVSNGSFVSTSSGSGSQDFFPNSSAQAIQTTFSTSAEGTLDWSNDAFFNRHALFCSFNTLVEVVFNQQLPQGCIQVNLLVIPLSQLVGSSGSTTSSTLAINTAIQPQPKSSSISTMTSVSPVSASMTTSSTTGPPTTTGTPNCFDGTNYDGSVNGGYLIQCETNLTGSNFMTVDASSLAECIADCSAAESQPSGSCVAVVYDILATSGACTLKSSIGPVIKGGNIFAQAAILATGSDAPPVVYANSSSSSMLSTSTTSMPSSESVLYTPVLSSSTSALYTSMSSTNTLSPSQASSSSGAASNTPAGSSVPTSAAGPSSTISSLSSVAASSSSTAQPYTSSPVAAQSSSTLLSSTPTTTTSSSFTGYATPTTSPLCNTYNHQVLNVNSDGYNYEVECSTSLSGTVLAGNSTTANSLQSCIRFCTLQNIGVPFTCLGVNFIAIPASTSPNCILFGAVSGTSFSAGSSAARLVYAGYSSPADPNYLSSSTTAITSTSTSSSTTSRALTTTTKVTSIVTSTISTSASPAQTTTASPTTRASSSSTTPFSQPPCSSPPSTKTTVVSTFGVASTYTYTTYTECPAPTASPSGQCFYYNYTGDARRTSSNYEIECASSFSGAALQPIIATDLHDCIGWCANQNALTANSCLGLSFQVNVPPLNGLGGNNCFRYSSLTCVNRTSANSGVYDSARLLYQNYPSIADYGNSAFNC